MADADVERVADGIRDRGGDRPGRAFPGAEGWRALRLENARIDLRRFRKIQDRIVVPGTHRKAIVVPADFLLQHPTGRLHDTALDLVEQSVAVHDLAGIDCGDDAVETDLVGHLAGRDDGEIGAPILVTPARAPTPGPLAPR